MKKGAIKWIKAEALRRPDGIISSKCRENNEHGFTPTYEREKRENMNFIMSNEYMRIWLKERKIYEIDTYSKYEVESDAGDIKRRFVQRFMKPKPTSIRVMPIITLKRFAHIDAKIAFKNKEKELAKTKLNK
ncbi:hypothetical protein RN001_008511 [Aquatica leii]|uniref:Uncharacterized protein n=1 Tax=Aquatica leii TaxID=1421715 RepID=A0AAN7SRD6_9COLE|nr:hypothetical protein RN001_008511 [Aquatica leii]